MNIPDGVACVHRSCLSHKTYPCPFCGRIDGRALTHVEKIAKAAMESLDMTVEEAWFEDCVKAIDPLVLNARVVDPIYRRMLTFDTSLINTEEEAKRLAALLMTEDDLRFEIPKTEPRPWISITDAVKNPERHTSDGGFLVAQGFSMKRNWLTIIWSYLMVPVHFMTGLLKGLQNDISEFDRQISAEFQIPPTLAGLPVYVASSKREEQERKDHYWKTVIMPRLREYLKEQKDG